jgi:hypothetical protein
MSAESQSIPPAEYSACRYILSKGLAAFQSILPAEYSTQKSAQSQRIPPPEYSVSRTFYSRCQPRLEYASRISEYSANRIFYPIYQPSLKTFQEIIPTASRLSIGIEIRLVTCKLMSALVFPTHARTLRD